jgi:pyruvate,water dikinase
VSKPYIAWLDKIGESGVIHVGRKADNIARMQRAGFRVPNGFCITTHAYQAFLNENAIPELTDERELAAEIEQGQFPDNLGAAIKTAYHELTSDIVAVRSSAVSEDLSSASFAGQQQTFLKIQGDEDLLDAVRQCWASLYSERALAYRQEKSIQAPDEGMAVLVQAMIPCDVAGVAFSRDPLTGESMGVIELAAGLGASVADGSAEVQRFTFDRTGDVKMASHGEPLLSRDQLQQVTKRVMDLEDFFGQPQDVEWGYHQDKLYLFQSRPITVIPVGFFTEVIPNDEFCWTSGFLNERFPQTLSPLGWTLIKDLIEPLGFRDPLRFMGFKPRAGMPILKLYRGHPFINMRVFQILFKPFPRCLLPEDTGRYFPGGNVELRKEAPYPCCLFDPRLMISMLWFFARDPANWSPLHNYRYWRKFASEYNGKLKSLQRKAEALGEKADPQGALSIIEEAQNLSGRLLAIHRWSLIWAEIYYSILRRLLTAWMGAERANALSAQLISGLPNKSLELNKALDGLTGESEWRAFLDTYGHRSYSLDVSQPTFMEDPDKVKQLADRIGGGFDLKDRSAKRVYAEIETQRELRTQSRGWFKARLFNLVHSYTQRYMPLREDQRFYWQKILALERRLILCIGKSMMDRDVLKRPEDIFFITMDELRQAVAGNGIPALEITLRQKEFVRLQQSYQAAPWLSYPGFLQGNRPLENEDSQGGDIFRGQPVSPGLARGPARLVAMPDQFDEILPGDILVTRGADPGWTVFFGRIAGLVMEAGGQLSHASVVAREYGLPAVAGVSGVMQKIENGQEIVIDGLSGTVTRV